MATDRRLVIERLKEKANRAYTALEEELNKDGHGPDCVLRCIENPSHDYAHYCPLVTCMEDEGINPQEHEGAAT